MYNLFLEFPAKLCFVTRMFVKFRQESFAKFREIRGIKSQNSQNAKSYEISFRESIVATPSVEDNYVLFERNFKYYYTLNGERRTLFLGTVDEEQGLCYIGG